jgi:hypothetical protein
VNESFLVLFCKKEPLADGPRAARTNASKRFFLKKEAKTSIRFPRAGH